MSLNKVTYVKGQTIITSDNLNNIQDSVATLEQTAEKSHTHANKQVLDNIINKNDGKKYVIKNGELCELDEDLTVKDVSVSGTDTAICTNAAGTQIKNLEISGRGDVTSGIKVTNMPIKITIGENVSSITPSTSSGSVIPYLGSFYYSRVETQYTDKLAYDENGALKYYKNTVKKTFNSKTGWTKLGTSTETTADDGTKYYCYRYTTTSEDDQIYTYGKLYQSTCIAIDTNDTSVTIADGSNTQGYSYNCVGIATTDGTMYVWLKLANVADLNALNTYLTEHPLTILGAAQKANVYDISESSISMLNSVMLNTGNNTVKFSSDGGLGCDFKFVFEQTSKTSANEIVNTHNNSTAAHPAIRADITALVEKINMQKRSISFSELIALCENVSTSSIADNTDGVKSVTFTASATCEHINETFNCEPFKTVLCEFCGKTSTAECSDTLGGYVTVEFYDKNGDKIGTSYSGDVLGESTYGYHRYGWIAPKGTQSAKFKIVTKGTTSVIFNDFALSVLDCMPRRGNASGIIYDAHLGLCNAAPRNTMIGFEMAKRAGFTSFVTNIQPTSDGVLVALHDSTIDATSNGTGSISTLTYQQLMQYDFGSWFNTAYTGTKIPKLETVLQFAAASGMHPILRLADNWNTDTGTAYMTQIYTMLKKYGLKKRATIKSFEINTLTACYGIMGNDVDYIWCLETDEPESWVYTSATSFTGDLTLEPMASLTQTCANTILSNGIKASAWTVNSPSQMRKLAKMGITRFCTDTFSDIVFPIE